MKKEKCECSFLNLLIGLVLVTLGIYLFVAGFLNHFINATRVLVNLNALIYYFAGVLLFSIGKLFKRNASCKCNIHG